MPNPSNVTAPITLVGAGRSGTTLLTEIFRKHPDVSVVGETTNLIFELWGAVEEMTGIVVPLLEPRGRVDTDELAARVVRQAFLTCFPHPSPRWMQKPLGVPKAVTERFATPDRWDAAAQWYWGGLERIFPDSCVLTILRNPCDVVLSSCAYWGYRQADIWWSLAFLCHLLVHPTAPIRHAISYERLTSEPEAQVHELFAAAGLEFADEALVAFAEIHSPAQGREKLTPEATSRRAQWERLDPRAATRRQLEAIERAYAHFGIPCELPRGLRGGADSPRPEREPAAPSSATTPSDAAIRELESLVAQLTAQIERLHIEFANRDAKRQIELEALRTQFAALAEEVVRNIGHVREAAAALPVDAETHGIEASELTAALEDLAANAERLWRAAKES